MDAKALKNTLEAVLATAEQPLSLSQLTGLFEGVTPATDLSLSQQVQTALSTLEADYQERGLELVKVASGYRLQARQEHAEWIGRLKESKPPRYSRAVLETLSLIAYRQPITRAEIEEVRGVSVSSHIIKSLLEREWIKVLGHRDVPGRPTLFGTTKVFLDYFGLKSLSELPSLPEIKALTQSEPKPLSDGASPSASEAVPQQADLVSDLAGQADQVGLVDSTGATQTSPSLESAQPEVLH